MTLMVLSFAARVVSVDRRRLGLPAVSPFGRLTMRQPEGNMRALFLGLVLVLVPAQSGAEIVWVDANGRTIAPLVGEAPPILGPTSNMAYLASDGLVWTMNAETATVSPSP